MGAIKKSLTQTDFHSKFGKWDPDVLLSFFCAGLEKKQGTSYYNFSCYYTETRMRLFKAVLARKNDTATKVQDTYIEACLETKRDQNMQHVDTPPTFYREKFIIALQQHPGSHLEELEADAGPVSQRRQRS
jgi:hypothetical protein